MVRIFPEELPNRIRNDLQRAAEVKLYDLLRTHLHDRWVVFYSVAWLGRTSTEGVPRDGETDFIIAHPEYGVLLIEVKGGNIRYEGARRQWVSTDSNGKPHDIDPFTQVVQCKYALLNKIKSLPQWANRWIVLGHAVAFPNTIISHIPLPPDAPPEIILDFTTLAHLPEGIIAIMRYWAGRDQHNTHSNGALITDLERLLAPSIYLPNPLSIQIEDEEQEMLRLTEEQFRTLDVLRRTRRAAISGCAGSGKTMLAAEKARRLAQEGFRTLLTCYSDPLAKHLEEVAGKRENLFIYTFHQLCYQIAREAHMNLPIPDTLDQQKIFHEDYPDALSEAIKLRPDLQYDAIIVDEGQDFHDTWWIALEECLTEGNRGIFYVFYDDNQRVYHDHSSFPSEIQYFPLAENVRNTRTIHRALATYYQGESPSRPRGPVGRSVEFHPCSTLVEVKRLLQHVLRKLTTVEQLACTDIVILTPVALRSSFLYELKIEGNIQLVERYKGDKYEILCSTISSFKGLERPVVIIVELDNEEFLRSTTRDALCYVAFSRPRSHLILFGRQEAVMALLPGTG